MQLSELMIIKLPDKKLSMKNNQMETIRLFSKRAE